MEPVWPLVGCKWKEGDGDGRRKKKEACYKQYKSLIQSEYKRDIPLAHNISPIPVLLIKSKPLHMFISFTFDFILL